MDASTDSRAPLMFARADGLAGSAWPVTLPFMAPRLQGLIVEARQIDLSLWGAGRLGRIRFTPLAGPYVYAPNRVEAAGGGVYVAQSAPALAVRGVRVEGLHPARRSAKWDQPLAAPARVSREGERRCIRLPWGVLVVEARGEDLVVAAGADAGEAERAMALSVDRIAAEANAYAARCDVLPVADPLMRGMAVQAAHAALSSIRADQHGRFAGLAAGEAYSVPARTYYRDAYWTAQVLLRLAPDAVRA